MIYKYIGWCHDEEKNQDKVWICIQLTGAPPDIIFWTGRDERSSWAWGGKFLTVWGRRGKKLQSKIIDYTQIYEMEKLARSKDAKGYCEIPENKLHEVYPEFQEDLEKTTAWALLKS